jgi:deoxyribonuclease V
MGPWPATREELVERQRSLVAAAPRPWAPGTGPLAVAGCFVCFPRSKAGAGARGDPAWAAAAVVRDGSLVAQAVVAGEAGAPYEAGLLALREGPLLEAAVRALAADADVLLVPGTGRDHQRRAGLAVHLGSVLGLPTVGVTHRPLLASGDWPADERGARAPLRLAGETVGVWLRTRRGTRPLAVHAAWRTTPAVAATVVLATASAARSPKPIRAARELARAARAGFAVL